MARPTNATALSFTSSGVPFQWLTEGYTSKGAPDANLDVMHALVAWDEAAQFLRDVVGYTEWDGTAALLDRTLPLASPLRDGLWCDSYELVDFGAYPERTAFNDPFLDNAPEQDWCVYKLTFVRPAYWVRSNETLISSYSTREHWRYCTFERRYSPRERRKSGYAFQYQKADTTWQTVPDEAAFIPDYQIEYMITWKQVPVRAVPELAIRAQLLTVNNAAFKFRAEDPNLFGVGELLFKGPQQGLGAYQGADGAFYEDLPYIFAYQPGGWNKYLRPDLVAGARDYGEIRRRVNGAPDGSGDPPYASSNFDKLFEPGA